MYAYSLAVNYVIVSYLVNDVISTDMLSGDGVRYSDTDISAILLLLEVHFVMHLFAFGINFDPDSFRQPNSDHSFSHSTLLNRIV